MRDLKTKINNVMKTGKSVIGVNQVVETLLTNNPKLIILSSNCPDNKKEDIIYYSKLVQVLVKSVKEDGIELGSICGKPFPVSAIGILDEGDSDIFSSFKK